MGLLDHSIAIFSKASNIFIGLHIDAGKKNKSLLKKDCHIFRYIKANLVPDATRAHLENKVRYIIAMH